MDAWVSKAIEICTAAGSKLILALLIFIIGKIIIGKLVKIAAKGKATQKLDPTVRGYLVNFVRIGLYVILVVSIIATLGVPMASVITVLASCGVAIGLALQGALSNVAGGIMMMAFRPFSVGDYISAAGEEGTVREIGLLYTTLLTVDNRKVLIPNGNLMGGNIVNVTAEDTRRVDLKFNCTGADIAKTRQVMMDVLTSCDKVLVDPAPVAIPLEGVAGGMTFNTRAWVKTGDYWEDRKSVV